jgi:uncharacterized protein YkwD
MQSAPARGRRGLAVVAAVLVLSAISVSLPAPTQASAESTMESSLRSWISRDRTARGLRPLRNDARLAGLSGDRATWMAARRTLTHTSADGNVCNALTKRSIYWYRCGEDIGWATGWGSTTAKYVYKLLRGSPSHWALLMSSRFNYVGVGVARSSDGRTYVSIVFIEGPDRTAPIPRMRTRSVSGRTVRFTWSAADVRLQTHTSGLKNFNVALRVDNGPYVQIRTGTTRTSLTLLHRARGHWYTVRIQARDRRGNLSAWSVGKRAWVP